MSNRHERGVPGIQERLVYSLLFLFPLAGNTVKSWTSTLFTLILFVALASRPWKKVNLLRWERWVLIAAAAMFVVMMISNISNGWGNQQTREFGVQVRFLAFVPIYLLLSYYEKSLQWLLRGTVFAALVLALQAVYEMYINGDWRVMGIYGSPGLYATQALLFASVLLFVIRKRALTKWPLALLAVGILAALAALMLSGSRSTYLTLAVMIILLPMFLMTWQRALATQAAMVLMLVGSYWLVTPFHDRVNSGFSEITAFIELKDPMKVGHLGSVGQRLEMWRAAWLIYKDNPVIGVGRGNFPAAAKTYAEAGLVHPQATVHPHPHNGYLEFMVSNGTIGLALLLFLLIYPLSVCMRSKSECRSVVNLGIVFLSLFIVSSVNEAATFIYGNFLSVYLIYFGVIFSFLGNCERRSLVGVAKTE